MAVWHFVALLAVSISWTSSFGQEVARRGPTITVSLASYDVSLTAFVSDGEPMAEVRLGGDRFVVPAGPELLGQMPDLKSNFRLDDQYLLIHAECACTAHGSSVSRVFAIRGGRLRKMGVVADDWDDSKPNKLDFSILDNQLEDTGLTSHAAAPNVMVPLREVDGKLRFDPSRCWQMNRNDYEKAKLAIATPDQGTRERESIASGFLEMIGVDKYCSRREPMEADLASARKLMPPEEFAELRKEISSLVVDRLSED